MIDDDLGLRVTPELIEKTVYEDRGIYFVLSIYERLSKGYESLFVVEEEVHV